MRLYSDTFGEIGYGSGFHMHYTTNSGFTRVDTAVAFLENEYPSVKYKNTNCKWSVKNLANEKKKRTIIKSKKEKNERRGNFILIKIDVVQ